jgi:hypothetical protein
MTPRSRDPFSVAVGLGGGAFAFARAHAGALRLTAAVVMVALAVLAGLLASDLSSWEAALRSGDTRFVQAPAAASWSAATTLPSGLSERVLDLSGQVAFRVAAQSFVAVHAAGEGVDNGFSE